MKHWIFTRFNRLDRHTSIYNNSVIPNPHVWMYKRMKLFEEITLPSVMAQSVKNFTWLLSFDMQTPRWIIKEYSKLDNVEIIYDYPKDHLISLYGTVLNKGDWIITSRLDNDDIILPEYIEKVQSYFNEEFLLVDTDGTQLELSTGKEYTVERRSQNSPFISLIEQVGMPYRSVSKDFIIDEPVKTVYYCSHTKMEWHFPSLKIPQRLYKMVIHDHNVSNKIIGKEI